MVAAARLDVDEPWRSRPARLLEAETRAEAVNFSRLVRVRVGGHRDVVLHTRRRGVTQPKAEGYRRCHLNLVSHTADGVLTPVLADLVLGDAVLDLELDLVVLVLGLVGLDPPPALG